MAQALVQQTSGTAATLAYGSNVTAGNLLVVSAAANTAGTTATISDTRGNSWTKMQGAPFVTANSGSSTAQAIFWAVANSSGACTVTPVLSAAVFEINVAEFSGLGSNVVQDGNTQTAVGTGTTVTTPSITTTYPVDLLISYLLSNDNTGAAFNSPWGAINANTAANNAWGRKFDVAPSSNASNYSQSVSIAWENVVIALGTPAGSAVTASSPLLSMLSQPGLARARALELLQGTRPVPPAVVVQTTSPTPLVVTSPTPDFPGRTLSQPARDGIVRSTPLPPTVVTSPAPAPVPQIVTRSAVAGICVPGTGGPLWANTGTNDASVGTVAWANTANIPLAPFPKAALTTGTQSQWLVLGTYGFSIPSTAVIQGIAVSITHATNQPSNVTDTGIRLVKGGVIGATDRSDPGVWPQADVTVNYGGPSDLWGDTWLPADINAANFGLALTASNSGGNATARIDNNTITVYYCDPFGAPSVGGPATRVVTSPTPPPVAQMLLRRGTDDAIQTGTITPQPVVISAVSPIPRAQILTQLGGQTSAQVEASGTTGIIFGSTAIPTVSAIGLTGIVFGSTGIPTESATGTSTIIFNSTGTATTPGGISTFVSMRGANSAFVNVASATTDAPFTGGILPSAKAGQCINVLAVTFNADTAADTLVFNSKGAGAGTAITALFSNPINGSVVWPYTPVGWFTTNGGEGLTVTTTGASPTHVQIIFELINA